MHIPLRYSIFSLFLRCVSLHQNLKIMNKKIIIPALIAATLTACGGGNTQNNGGADNSQTATQTTAQTTEAAKPAALKPVYVVADRLGGKFILEDPNIEYDKRRVVPAQTPDSLKNFKYILKNGKYYPVKLEGYQVGSKDGDSGRETWINFDNMAGWVYRMESGRLLENPENEYDACWAYPLLVDEAFKSAVKVYPATSTYKNDKKMDLPKDLAAKFETQYGRKIMHASLDYTFGDNNEYKFVNLRFKNKGSQAFAVVAVVKPDGSICPLDLPRQWDDCSTWRADDCGEFYGYGLDFATVEDGKLYVYLVDGGAEGNNYGNYEVADSLRLGNVNASFYTAPE